MFLSVAMRVCICAMLIHKHSGARELHPAWESAVPYGWCLCTGLNVIFIGHWCKNHHLWLMNCLPFEKGPLAPNGRKYVFCFVSCTDCIVKDNSSSARRKGSITLIFFLFFIHFFLLLYGVFVFLSLPTPLLSPPCFLFSVFALILISSLSIVGSHWKWKNELLHACVVVCEDV